MDKPEWLTPGLEKMIDDQADVFKEIWDHEADKYIEKLGIPKVETLLFLIWREIHTMRMSLHRTHKKLMPMMEKYYEDYKDSEDWKE